MTDGVVTAPKVAVVICTRNREHSIATAVRSVLASDHPNFDLTIIDQSTTGATKDAIDAAIDGDPRVHYVHTEEAGLSRAYNRGVRETTGDIIAFTDDDCVVGPDWLTSIVEAFAAEPDADLLYGQVVPYEPGEQMLAETPYLMNFPASRLSKRDGFKVFGMGANFAARRRLFDTVGYFDEILGGGGPLKSSQDFDMTYRTYRSGGVVILRPEVVIRHDGRRAPEDWPTLLSNYGFGDGAFYTKHVRCRDPYATWLLARQFARSCAKWLFHTVTRRGGADGAYVRGILQGARGSFRFAVDRRARLYVER